MAAKHTDKKFQSTKQMREQFINRKKSMESSRSHSFGSSESDHPNTVTHRQIALNRSKVVKASAAKNTTNTNQKQPVGQRILAANDPLLNFST